MSYSQFDEEAAILKAFIGYGPGRFLDIGAWHPTTFSNTRRLYEHDWSGVMIEPSPGPVLNLLAEYGNADRVVLVQACVGLEPGLIAMHVTNDAVTTANDAVYQQWKDTVKFNGSMMAYCITMADISNRFGGFDFVNLDAEGSSVDLFLEMQRLGWTPRCVCVEHDDRMAELCGAATAAGYAVTYSNGTNAVLVRR